MAYPQVTPLIRQRLVVVVAALGGLFVPWAQAQVVSGSITGAVVDSSGASVPGALVTLVNAGTQDSRSLETNVSGDFVFAAVNPGVYTIRVQHAGFQTFQRTSVELTANERLFVGKVELTVGDTKESITVQAHGSAVQAASSENSALLSSRQLELLGTRSRDVISLLYLLPGVSLGGGGELPTGSGFGNPLPNIEGTRSIQTRASVDGLQANSLGQPLYFMSTSMDSISEVKVLLNNYPAEYAGNGGAVINLVTKSGSNEYHGGAYWFKRHEEFNANNFFNNRQGLSKPMYRYGVVGATLGGPLKPWKRKGQARLFFFYSFERWFANQPTALTDVTVPTARERLGDFSQTLDLNSKLVPIRDPSTNAPFSGNVIPASRINKNGQALLSVFPLPNALNRALTLGNYNFQNQSTNVIAKTQHLFRTDYRLSDKDTLYVRGINFQTDTNGPTAGGSCYGTWGLMSCFYDFTDQGLVVHQTHLFTPTLINELSAGARHGPELAGPSAPKDLEGITRSAIGMPLGQFHPEINPLNIIPEATFGGVPDAPSITFDDRFPNKGGEFVMTISDTLSYIRGSHTMKAGLLVQRYRDTKGTRGRGNFSGLFSFARDVNNPLDYGYAYANTMGGSFQSYTEATFRYISVNLQWGGEWFAQDSWKLGRKLTLEYGVRFGRFQWPHQIGRDGIAAFVPNLYSPANAPRLFQPVNTAAGRQGYDPVSRAIVPASLIGAEVPNSGNVVDGMVLGTQPGYPLGFRDPMPVLWEPRFGFAYDIQGNGKSAIRGGFGVFHQPTPRGQIISTTLMKNPPIQFNPVYYYGTLDTFLSSSGYVFPPTVYGVQRNAKVPTTYNFSLAAQRDVGRSIVVSVGYVGMLQRHQQWYQDLNEVAYGAHFLPQNADPTNPSTPLNDNFLRPYPGYSSIQYYQNAGTANYNAMQVTANRRFVHGVQFGLAYTWSKTMDFVDDEMNAVATYVPVEVWNHGKAGFDQTHVLVFNYNWDLPKVRGLPERHWLRYVLDNWQLAGTTTFASGFPSGVSFSTVDGADITGGGDGARVIVTGKAELPHSERKFNEWFNPLVFARPPKGNIGDAPKDVFRLPGTNNWDMCLFKYIPIRSEKRNLQLRWEAYNAFNHTQFNGVNASARFDATGHQVNGQFGQVTSAANARIMQASVRFNF